MQRNIKTATLKEFEDVVKEWLRGAKDRDGGRKIRLATNNPEPVNELEN